MKRVLLLGAAGQLGTAITSVFEKRAVKLAGLTRNEFDADTDDVGGKLGAYSDCDYLINCIAHHKVDQCESNFKQSFAVNAEFVLALSRFCTANDMTLVHLSTDYVFDGGKREAYFEYDLPNPLNIYGTSKLAGEVVAHAYAQKHFILRVSSMFGTKEPYDPNMNFVEKMVDAAQQGRELNVIDDQIMSPTYTDDVARAILAIIDSDFSEYGLYHACNSGECSWYDFAQKIFELTGLSNKLTPTTYSKFHTKARRPQFCSMDNTKLRAVHTMRPWEQALKDYLSVRGYLKNGVVEKLDG